MSKIFFDPRSCLRLTLDFPSNVSNEKFGAGLPARGPFETGWVVELAVLGCSVMLVFVVTAFPQPVMTSVVARSSSSSFFMGIRFPLFLLYGISISFSTQPFNRKSSDRICCKMCDLLQTQSCSEVSCRPVRRKGTSGYIRLEPMEKDQFWMCLAAMGKIPVCTEFRP